MEIDNTKARSFDNPVAVPLSEEQALAWQQSNREWWEQHSMRYDWRDAIPFPEFSPQFYAEIDRRFFSVARGFMPWKRIPFDPLIDFDTLPAKDVLEIGVGNGSHAALLSAHAKSFVGIDLTEYAVRSTGERLRQSGSTGQVERMDAEKLAFPGASFDFIWSWGVIHHSSDISKIISEMHRVLRPGGTAVVMVYHRNAYNYYIVSGILNGLLRRGLWKHGSIHKVQQAHTDGAMARYYTPKEWRRLVGPFFNIIDLRVYGAKAEIMPLPGCRVKSAILSLVPDAFGRMLTNTCGLGSMLVAVMERR